MAVHKKAGSKVRLFCQWQGSGGDEVARIGHGALGTLHFAQGFAYDLLGQAGAFATLAGHTEAGTNITIAAAAFVDRIADLAVGYTFAETDIHEESPLLRVRMGWILMLMRMSVKA
jgi:hypothetical protein